MISTIAQPLTPPAKPDSVLLWIKRVVFFIVFALLIILLFIFTALAADRVIAKSNIPSVFGFSPLTVLTGSMEPEIYPGDMVVIHRQSDYAVGDTITYVVEGGKSSVTHKIIRSYVESGTTYYITQGINNNTEDEFPVAKSQVAGKVVLIIPGLGTFLEWLKTPSGIVLILLFACIVVAAVYIIKV